MRLGDLEQLKEEILWGNVYLSDNEVNALVDAISNQPTIDPETLPIVKELRAELERQKRRADKAVEWMRMNSWCAGCKHLKGITGCDIYKLKECSNDSDFYELREDLT